MMPTGGVESIPRALASKTIEGIAADGIATSLGREMLLEFTGEIGGEE